MKAVVINVTSERVDVQIKRSKKQERVDWFNSEQYQQVQQLRVGQIVEVYRKTNSPFVYLNK